MKKLFTLIAATLMAVGAQAQEKLALDKDATYTDEQVLNSTNASVTLGKDQKNAAYDFENAATDGKYLTDFIVACKDKDGKDINGVVAIHGGNNPKDGTTGNTGSGIDCTSTKTSASLPQSGTFYVFKAAKAGKVQFGMVLNSGKAFYVIDANEITEDGGKKRVALPASNITDYVIKDANGTAVEVTINDVNKGGGTVANKVLGFAEFKVEANHPYYIFCTGSKLSFFGYIFTGTDGIKETVSAKTAQNGVSYNLAGQKVDGTYKGIVIKDGKKMIQK